MIVSSNNLLNILLPNDNKVLKEALKDADSKTLQDMVKNKSTSVNDILKNLFDDVKNGTKSNATIENILKNTNAFKDLGSFSKSLMTVLNQIDSNSNLDKYKPALQSFFKDIKNLDENSLKEQLSKSGVFLESKMAASNSKQGGLPPTMEKLLNQIQTIIKDMNTPAAKQINELIGRLIQQNTNQSSNTSPMANSAKNVENFKSLVALLQNVTSSLGNKETANLSALTNQLKSMISQGSMVESKLENLSLKDQITNQTKQILAQMKNEIASNQNMQNLSRNLTSQLDNLIKSNDLFAKNGQIIQSTPNLNNVVNSPLLNNLAQQSPKIANLLENLKAIITQPKVENANLPQINNIKEQINTQTKELLAQIKNEVLISKDPVAAKNIVNQIDNLLKTNDLFAKNDKLIEPKALLNNLLNSNEIKQASTQSQNISNLVLNLKNVSENITNLENKASNFTNITTQKAEVLNDLKQNIASLKNELLNIKNIDTKAVNQIISKLENVQNLFSKVEVPTTQQQTVSNTGSPNIQNPNASVQMQTANTTNPNALNANVQKQTTNLNNPLNQALTNQTTQQPQQTQANISFSNNFANNLNTLLLSLKESIVNLSASQNNPTNTNAPAIQNQIMSVVEKIEVAVKESIQTTNINQGLNPLAQKAESNPISNDMKTVLLQMQEELASKTDPKSQEMFKQVDRMLMQIDYHQLLSLSSNSNYVYVPFFWDMLEDGSISMKKTDEDKFYCQINLTLKDYGKVDLMLALYDKNKLDLTIHAQREHFKEDVRHNIQKLKKALNDVDLIPVNIKLLDLKEEKTIEEKQTSNYVNPYSNEFGSGIDIRV